MEYIIYKLNITSYKKKEHKAAVINEMTGLPGKPRYKRGLNSVSKYKAKIQGRR